METWWFLMSVLLLCEAQVSQGRTRAVFIFGDSLVDSGNNNFLNSFAKANFAPNGIDYPGHLGTGRFCNGRLVADFISEFIGAEPVLPILDPNNRGSSLLRGANFASAGSGILDDTGTMFVQRLRVSDQLNLFQQYKNRVTSIMGPRAANRLIAEGLYSFTFGGNDYINNYLQALSPRARQFTPSQYNSLLISTYKQQLRQIYNLGARKISVGNIGPVGCIPSQLSQRSNNGGCVPKLNEYARGFNALLKPMLQELNRELRGAVFVYVNAYDLLYTYIQNAKNYGFSNTNVACCGQGNYNGVAICTAFSSICSDRNKYVFWDPYHPTEKVNRLIAQATISGGPNDISPLNLQQVLALP